MLAPWRRAEEVGKAKNSYASPTHAEDTEPVASRHAQTQDFEDRPPSGLCLPLFDCARSRRNCRISINFSTAIVPITKLKISA